MKRFYSLFLLMVIVSFSHAEDNVITIRNTSFFTKKMDKVKEISQNTSLRVSETKMSFKVRKNNNDKLFFTEYSDENTDYYIPIDDLIPFGDTDYLPSSMLTKEGDRYFIKTYFDALFKNDPGLVYNLFKTTIESEKGAIDYRDWEECVLFYQDSSYISHIRFDLACYYSSYNFFLKNIKAENDMYRISAVCSSYSEWNEEITIPENERPVFNEEYTIFLKIDGDYISLYLNNRNNLLQTFIRTNEQTDNEFLKFLKTGSFDQKKITWPRYADGSSDYDDKIILNTRVESLYQTTDNLRLRSAEETTSDILTTLVKDTRVVVTKLGKQQTIDGITANWVKVKLDDGTEGWCFGGYLLEIPVEMEVPGQAHTEEVKDTPPAENDEKDIPDETGGDISGSPFPLLPVAGGVILVVVIALAVVIAKRRKG